MSIEDITAAAQAQENQILEDAKPPEEEKVEVDVMKEDVIIEKTIEKKKKTILDAKENKKSSIFGSSTPEKKKDEKEEETSSSYTYGGYGYGGYYASTKQETESEKEAKRKKERIKRVLSENVDRLSREEQNENIFMLYEKSKKKRPSKFQDVAERSIITAAINCFKKIYAQLEDD